MRHLFVMDPLEQLNLALDSSLRMAFELQALGHDIFLCEPRNLAWPSGNSGPTTQCRQITFKADAPSAAAGPLQSMRLDQFGAIHMRKDPPYDLDYIAATWLLDPATRSSKVYNSPAALRKFNEKLAILQFPEDIRPALVSANPAELLAFTETVCHGDAVIKPLTLFGGRGVLRLDMKKSSREAIQSTLRAETADGSRLRLAQPFDSAIFDGEVRAFTAFGEPIAWCLKKPASGQFLANTRLGAELLPYQPTAEVEARVRRVAQTLLRDGVTFIGFDLIGGYLSEINLTSPRLLLPPDAPGEDGRAPYRAIAAMIQRDLGR